MIAKPPPLQKALPPQSATMNAMSARRFTVLHVLQFVALVLIAPPAHAGGASCETHSAPHRVAVLELYTSEGCNSCPPVDRWVSSLPAMGFASDRVIPLAFHVDYWDQLGWPDRLAKAEFSTRQRQQAARQRAGILYTPQLLLNGADFQFGGKHFEAQVGEINRRAAGAELVLRQRPNATALEMELQTRLAPADTGAAQIFIALTENGLQSAIRGGENEGKLLHHDFVVRELLGPLPKTAAGRNNWTGTVALRPEWKRPELFLVAFVQDEKSGDIRQALRTPLCPRQ